MNLEKIWNTTESPNMMLQIIQHMNVNIAQLTMLKILRELCEIAKIEAVLQGMDYLIDNIDWINRIDVINTELHNITVYEVPYVELMIEIIDKPSGVMLSITESFPMLPNLTVCNVIRKHIKLDDY